MKKYLLGVVTLLCGLSAVSEVIYQETFSGSSSEYLHGQTPDITTNGNTWTSRTDDNPWMADGSTAGSLDQNCNALLPFSPAAGHVYTLAMNMNPTSGYRWFELGFSQNLNPNYNFTSSYTQGIAWFYLRRSRTDSAAEAGGTFSVGTAGQVTFNGSGSLAGMVFVKIVLDTTKENWSVEWFVNDVSIRSYTYASNPSINYVGFTRTRDSTAGTVDNFQLVMDQDLPVIDKDIPSNEGPFYHLTKPDPNTTPMWDMDALSQTPQTWPASASDYDDAEVAPGITPLFYEGEVYTGMTTRVFAWVGIPTNGPGPFPGMVLVHGGWGTAYQEWVQLWMDRGYAAIAMDTAGQVPVSLGSLSWKHHEYAGPEGWGGFDQLGDPVTDQWMYHAVAAVIRGHSLLRSYPQVDTNRIGLTGISWGGIITCNTVAYDHRFAFAAPIYGCGFLGEDSSWLYTTFRPSGEAFSLAWLNLWDAGRYIGRSQTPMFFVNGTNDKHFRLGSWQKTYRQPDVDVTLCCKVRLAHSDVYGRVPEVIAYADAMFQGGTPLVDITDVGRSGQDVWLTYSPASDVASADLNYTTDGGMWTGRYWQTVSAVLEPSTRRVTAVIPANTTAWYFNLVNEDGMISSSPHEELTGYEQIAGNPSNLVLAVEPSGQIQLDFDIEPTARYTVEAATNLLDGSGWADISSPMVNDYDGSVRFFSDNAGNHNQCYFRVRSSK